MIWKDADKETGESLDTRVLSPDIDKPGHYWPFLISKYTVWFGLYKELVFKLSGSQALFEFSENKHQV